MTLLTTLYVLLSTLKLPSGLTTECMEINIEPPLQADLYWRISFAQMTHFADRYFLFNPHLKGIKSGLSLKPHVLFTLDN